MMKHEEWQILVSAYHDGELDERELRLVESHLAECAECAAALENYRRLGQAIQALPQREPSRTLWLRVREQLTRQPGLPLWRRLMPLASVVTTLLVSITLIVVLGSNSKPGRVETLGAVPASATRLQQEDRAVEKEVLAEPTAAPASAPHLEGVPAPSSVPQEAASVPSAVMNCPGMPLSLELVELATRTDSQLSAPRVSGVLYDAVGDPLPQSTLVFSGTANWQGIAETDSEGIFYLDLPQEGRYRLVLALAKGEYDEEQLGMLDVAGSGDTTWNEVDLPAVGPCLAPWSTNLPAVTLGPQEEAILSLRAE